MNLKLAVVLLVLCNLASCEEPADGAAAAEQTTKSPPPGDKRSLRNWQPFRLMRWGHNLLTGLHSSSGMNRDVGDDYHGDIHEGSVRKELVTMMFEAMLDHVVESWETISVQKLEEPVPCSVEIGKTQSELNVKQKKKYGPKPSKTGRRSRSRLELTEIDERQPMTQQSWWSSPDERAVIRFRNGNQYEGPISMKTMNGSGRFQWADGTVYMGNFKDNEICGTGLLKWKDDTWYEGSFQGNLRHGRGLYVDSRRQRSYVGDWHCGTKHGRGVIYYSGSFQDSYDGEWVHNVRHGVGTREYSRMSGYNGEWDRGIREGKGLMIWPNHDFYTGHWKNGVMSGYGYYIWDTFYNNSMSLPSMNTYRGEWERGQRNGYGVLSLGLGLGSHYTGEFKNNKKHGAGKFVTNNGLIVQDDHLFTDDNLGLLPQRGSDEYLKIGSKLPEPFEFNICDSSVGLLYHIKQALDNIDREYEARAALINDYLQANKGIEDILPQKIQKNIEEPRDMDDLIEFEETSLKKALRCYETKLRSIYHQYATICNQKEVKFGPIMIRLYLWQLYYDCKLHQKGLTLVEIDNIFSRNPEWLARQPHNPFEKIYFWQFMHSLVSIANKLYATRHLPGVKPDTILASAFRKFMDVDILPGAGQRQGRLVNGYAEFVPLKALYALYCSIGSPHTVRQSLRAARRSPHAVDTPQPPIIDAPDDALPLGENYYAYGDEMTFALDHPIQPNKQETYKNNLKLFNFGNLSSKTILDIFGNIFPQLYSKDKIMDLDVEITFFEFFEAFMACTEESIRVKDEEMRWREKIEQEINVLSL